MSTFAPQPETENDPLLEDDSTDSTLLKWAAEKEERLTVAVNDLVPARLRLLPFEGRPGWAKVELLRGDEADPTVEGHFGRPFGEPADKTEGWIRELFGDAFSLAEVESIALQVEFGIAAEKTVSDVLSSEELLAKPPTGWLIENTLPENGLATIYARDSQGKTFQALDWASHVSFGRDWHGRKVAQAPVLYVIAEGVGKFGLRHRAWLQYHDYSIAPHLFFYPKPVRLLGDGDTSSDVGVLVEHVQRVGAKLVIFDTFNRCLGGGSENAPGDMAAALQALDAVRTANDTTVLVLHHSDKANRDARGHTLLFDAMDAKFRTALSKDELTVSCLKQRDGKDGWKRTSRLQEVDLGYDLPDGTRAKSCVLAAGKQEKPQVAARDVTQAILTALQKADGLTIAALNKEIDIPRTTLRRRLTELEDDGDVEKKGSTWRTASA